MILINNMNYDDIYTLYIVKYVLLMQSKENF